MNDMNKSTETFNRLIKPKNNNLLTQNKIF